MDDDRDLCIGVSALPNWDCHSVWAGFILGPERIHHHDPNTPRRSSVAVLGILHIYAAAIHSHCLGSDPPSFLGGAQEIDYYDFYSIMIPVYAVFLFQQGQPLLVITSGSWNAVQKYNLAC